MHSAANLLHGYHFDWDSLDQQLCDFSTSTSPLVVAAAMRHALVIEMLLEAGANINGSQSRMTITPLLVAVANGKHLVGKVLLDHSADAN